MFSQGAGLSLQILLEYDVLSSHLVVESHLSLVQRVEVILLVPVEVCPVLLVLEHFGQDALGRHWQALVVILIIDVHASAAYSVELVL